MLVLKIGTATWVGLYHVDNYRTRREQTELMRIRAGNTTAHCSLSSNPGIWPCIFPREDRCCSHLSTSPAFVHRKSVCKACTWTKGRTHQHQEVIYFLGGVYHFFMLMCPSLGPCACFTRFCVHKILTAL